MRHELDPIRHAPLPDSFERTAAWLREPPPPAAPRRAPAAALAALLIFVAACSWPVSVLVPVGSVVEAVSADRVDLQHPALRLVAEMNARHRVELEPVDAEWQAGTVMRFAFAGRSDASEAERWADSLASVPGVQTLRVVRLDAKERDLLGLATIRRMLGRERALSDAAVQAELDRAFEQVGGDAARPSGTVRTIHLADGIVLRLSTNVETLGDSAGAVRFESRGLGMHRQGGTAHSRNWLSADSAASLFTHQTDPVLRALGEPIGYAVAAALSDAQRGGGRSDSTTGLFMTGSAQEVDLGDDIILRLDAHLGRQRRGGALTIDTAAGARIIVLSRILRSDSLALPPGFHVDTVHVTRDSL